MAAVDKASVKRSDKVELPVGDVDAEFAKSGTIVEAHYLTPYCEQMPMEPLEPLNGTAMVSTDKFEIWHPKQHTAAVQQSGGAPENVTVHQTFVDGCFGRCVFSGDVRMVVAVAKGYPGVPVHTIWSREEATCQGRYRPLMAGYLEAGWAKMACRQRCWPASLAGRGS